MELHDVLAGLAVLVGLVGIVLVFVPGLLLQVVAVAIWAMVESTVGGWVVLGLVVGLALAATILKYLFPARRLKDAGVPGWLVLVALVVAIVGFFLIPVVGAPIGFILTIYVFARMRHGKPEAWPSTRLATRAVLTAIGIELVGGFLVAVVFFAGVLLG